MRIDPYKLAKVFHDLPPLVSDICRLFPNEVVLAGGAVRDLYLGEDPRDYDLFVSPNLRIDAVMRGAARERTGIPATAWTKTGDYSFSYAKGGPMVQLCHGRDWAKPEDLIETFDFTVCQASVWYEGPHWGAAWGECFKKDVTDKRLALVAGMDRTTPERIIRFYSRGYFPDLVAGGGSAYGGVVYMHQEVDTLLEQIVKLDAAILDGREQIEELKAGPAIANRDKEIERLKAKLASEDLFIARVKAKVAARELERAENG